MKILLQITNIAVVVSASSCLFSPAMFADAFSSQGPREIARTKTSSTIFLQEPSNHETTSILEEEKTVGPPSQGGGGDESTVVKDTIRKIGKSTRKAVVFGTGIVFNCIGLYFGLGLLLNLFGYAYSFSLQDGYKIDTIQNKRIEIQFERESRRYENEHSATTLSQSQSAVNAVARAEATATAVE